MEPTAARSATLGFWVSELLSFRVYRVFYRVSGFRVYRVLGFRV